MLTLKSFNGASANTNKVIPVLKSLCCHARFDNKSLCLLCREKGRRKIIKNSRIKCIKKICNPIYFKTPISGFRYPMVLIMAAKLD